MYQRSFHYKGVSVKFDAGDFMEIFRVNPYLFNPLKPITLRMPTNKFKGKGKGIAIPLKALTGPEGSRRLRLPD
jgi:hypothetical protein